MARRNGATDEILDTLGDLDRCPLTEAEKAAVRFAEKMTLDWKNVGEEGMAAMREHYTPEQVVEIACTVGLFNYLNRFAEAMGLWPTGPGEGGPDDTE